MHVVGFIIRRLHRRQMFYKANGNSSSGMQIVRYRRAQDRYT